MQGNAAGRRDGNSARNSRSVGLELARRRIRRRLSTEIDGARTTRSIAPGAVLMKFVPRLFRFASLMLALVALTPAQAGTRRRVLQRRPRSLLRHGNAERNRQARRGRIRGLATHESRSRFSTPPHRPQTRCRCAASIGHFREQPVRRAADARRISGAPTGRDVLLHVRNWQPATSTISCPSSPGRCDAFVEALASELMGVDEGAMSGWRRRTAIRIQSQLQASRLNVYSISGAIIR